MHWKEIASRLKGLSVFGASWDTPEPGVTKARRVIAFLEDRRVLYNPYELEELSHCVESVIEIRHFLTEIIADMKNKKGLSQVLRAMRAACRKFLDTVQGNCPSRIPRHTFDSLADGWVFHSAIGELRGTIGMYLAIIAVKYKLGIEGDLAAILPAPSDTDEESSSETQNEE